MFVKCIIKEESKYHFKLILSVLRNNTKETSSKKIQKRLKAKFKIFVPKLVQWHLCSFRVIFAYDGRQIHKNFYSHFTHSNWLEKLAPPVMFWSTALETSDGFKSLNITWFWTKIAIISNASSVLRSLKLV